MSARSSDKTVVGLYTVGALAITYAVASRFFYFHDDIKWSASETTSAPWWSYVHSSVNDHFAPGFLIISRAVLVGSEGRYWIVAAVLAVLATTTLLLGIAFLRALGLPLGSASLWNSALLGPFVLSTVTWWSAAAHALAAGACTMAMLLIWAKDPAKLNLRRFTTIALCQFAALAFSQKTLIWVILLPVAAYLLSRASAFASSHATAIRVSVRVLAAQLCAAAAHVLWAIAANWSPPTGQPLGIGMALSGVRTITHGLVPAITIGPASSGPTAGVAPGSALFGVLRAAIVVGVMSWWAIRRRWQPALFVFGGLTIDRLALLRARTTGDIETSGRYFVDAAIILLVAVGLSWATAPTVAADSPSVRRRDWYGVIGATLLIGIVAVVQPLQADEPLRRSDSWRTAFDEVRHIESGRFGELPILDQAVPWDRSAYPYSRPRHFLDLAQQPGDQVETTMTGFGPFLAFGVDGRLVASVAAPEQSRGLWCSTDGVVEFPIALDVPDFDRRAVVVDVWLEITARTESAFVVQLNGSVSDPSGQIDGWFNPTFELVPEKLSVPAGVTVVHVPLNPRWFGSVTGGRVLVSSGDVCIDAIGFGALQTDL